MGEMTGVDTTSRIVHMRGIDGVAADLRYDYLILATGATGSYFGHEDWVAIAPYPKTIADALVMRDKVLKAFEYAELEADPAKHRDLLTFVLVGAGPTGVEMAGALAAMACCDVDGDVRWHK